MIKKLIIRVLLLAAVVFHYPLEAGDVAANLEITHLENPYINFLNIWGGNSLKITFNYTTMKIEAYAESGNFGDSENNFTFMTISKSTGEALLNVSANSKYVSQFTQKINGAGFSFGDIMALNINPSSGLRNPTLNSRGSSSTTNCIGKAQYFAITPNGLESYTPHINVEPLQILGEGLVTEATVKGTTLAGNTVSVSVNGQTFSGVAGTDGQYTISVSDKAGFTVTTPLIVSVGEFKVEQYPELLPKNNLPQETITGYRYMLNAGLNYLTSPFPDEILYATTRLSPEAVKAWNLVYRALLNYDNTANSYPRDSGGNVILYVDYESHGIKITGNDAQMIQKYLVRNCPRMFLLKDWGASPVYDGPAVIGQNFHIGNSAQDGNDFQQQLLQTEASVTRLLSLIQPDMSIYQIIQVIQVNYESMVTYSELNDNSDIRGAFITHTAICGGYAKGYEYLLQRLGIENIWVEGHAGGGLHAWNFVNLYSNWYLSDTTWGGKNWFLDGADSPFTKNHEVMNIYEKMPALAKESVPWGIGDPDQVIANLTGIVNYGVNPGGTLTITYEDKLNINSSVQVNLSTDGYNPIGMSNDGHGLWSVTFPSPPKLNQTADFVSMEPARLCQAISAAGSTGRPATETPPAYFYFTINNQYYTSGDIKTNHLEHEIMPNGMNNAVLRLTAS